MHDRMHSSTHVLSQCALIQHWIFLVRHGVTAQVALESRCLVDGEARDELEEGRGGELVEGQVFQRTVFELPDGMVRSGADVRQVQVVLVVVEQTVARSVVVVEPETRVVWPNAG